MAKSKSFIDRFRVRTGQKIQLDRIDPADTDGYPNKRAARKDVAGCVKRLRELQYRLYAENRRSLLIVLQGLDASGKDGIIRHVLGFMNPQGCRVTGFKVPTEQEAAHDFLWRIHKATPARREVAIFNRSHYEDVLVVRVHGLVPKSVWEKRYQRINEFERNLSENHTHILKFFLHISPEEQLRRFKKRLEDPKRQWKISEADYAERAFWNDYQKAYEDVLERCSTRHAPWYVIPADHKWFRNLAVSQIMVESLESMRMQWPRPQVDLALLRKKYHETLNDS